MEAVTCAPETPLAEARELVAGSELDFCVVVNEEGIVAGVLRGDALAKAADAAAADVMELGPRTTRPSRPVEELLRKRSSQGVKHWIVTTAHGELLGVLARVDAERALENGPPSER